MTYCRIHIERLRLRLRHWPFVGATTTLKYDTFSRVAVIDAAAAVYSDTARKDLSRCPVTDVENFSNTAADGLVPKCQKCFIVRTNSSSDGAIKMN